MRKVFADSAYWIALRDKQDRFHQRSMKLAHWLVKNRCILVVTPFIFAETQAYFCRVQEIRELVIRDFWSNPVLSYEQPSYEDQKKAVKILTEHKDKSYSFADAVSFVVMTRLGLSEVVTFDRHFAQFGEFTVIDGSLI